MRRALTIGGMVENLRGLGATENGRAGETGSVVVACVGCAALEMFGVMFSMRFTVTDFLPERNE